MAGEKKGKNEFGSVDQSLIEKMMTANGGLTVGDLSPDGEYIGLCYDHLVTEYIGPPATVEKK